MHRQDEPDFVIVVDRAPIPQDGVRVRPVVYTVPPAVPAGHEVGGIDAERLEIEAERRKERERLVSGLDNRDLNALLRVFDKQVHHVHIRAPSSEPPELKQLDLVPSPNEEFDIDKLRSYLERFYASIVVGLLDCGRELQRIRGWEDGGTRTAVSLTVYSIAWTSDLIISAFLIFLAILVLVPASRDVCFRVPEYKIVPEDPQEDGVSKDRPHGPAETEGQANQWAQSMQDMLMSLTSPTGGGGGSGKVGEMMSEEVNGVLVQDMRRQQAVDGGDGKVDKKDVAIELYGKPTMRIIGGLADKWERIANSLNPTPPFYLEPHRVRVFYLLLVPALVLSTFVSARVFSRLFGLIFGVLLFGKPLTSRAVAKLDEMVPHWREKLILENNILSDVPTNSQLILRLLRDAEHKRRPLPIPEMVESEFQSADEGESEEDEEDEGEDDEESGKSSMGEKMQGMKAKMSNGLRSKARRTWDKLGGVKEEGFARITGHKKVDYRAKAESALDNLNIRTEGKRAKALVEKLPTAPDEDSPDNPSRFYVHHVKHGPGHLIIHPPTIPDETDGSFTSARITLTTIRRVAASGNVALASEDGPSKGALTISINDIISIKKEGMHLPGRIITSWALDADGAGGTGLEIKVVRRGMSPGGVTVEEETEEGKTQGRVETIKLKGIVRRNELFDRLLSLGEQQWEML